MAIDLSLAALDFAHAQSILERVRPDLPARCAAVDPGDVDPDECLVPGLMEARNPRR